MSNITVGDCKSAVAVSVDNDRQRLSLSSRQTHKNPWDSVQERYPVGSKVHGKVRKFTAYGAFVELEEGIEGMVHISNMSRTRRIIHPAECLLMGEEVDVVVLDVNAKWHHISLGLKQTQPDPWIEITSKYPVGMVVKGRVSKIVTFGAFVELENGVVGLLHISQIGDQRIDKIRDALAVGQEVEVRVIKVDCAERRICLSTKAKNKIGSGSNILKRIISFKRMVGSSLFGSI